VFRKGTGKSVGIFFTVNEVEVLLTHNLLGCLGSANHRFTGQSFAATYARSWLKDYCKSPLHPLPEMMYWIIQNDVNTSR
jgi:hypothetical protein